jgi:hypothetical protein
MLTAGGHAPDYPTTDGQVDHNNRAPNAMFFVRGRRRSERSKISVEERAYFVFDSPGSLNSVRSSKTSGVGWQGCSFSSSIVWARWKVNTPWHSPPW